MNKFLIISSRIWLSIILLTLFASMIKVREARAQISTELSPRDKTISNLLTIIRDEQLQQRDPDLVLKIILQLEAMKAVQAVDDLVRLLTFKHSYYCDYCKGESTDTFNEEEHSIWLPQHYPAIGALFKIGKPALPALIKVIESNEVDSLPSKNAVYTVESIFSQNYLEGAEYLREMATKASFTYEAHRLLEAAQQLQDTHAKVRAILERENRSTD
jgi:hypothetical protein